MKTFTEAMFEAFPAFRVEVAFSKPSTRKVEHRILNIRVRLWDDYVEKVYGCTQQVSLFELQGMEDPKIYWEELAGRMKLELLKKMENTEEFEALEVQEVKLTNEKCVKCDSHTLRPPDRPILKVDGLGPLCMECYGGLMEGGCFQDLIGWDLG
jgi:hypothetical protein